VEGDAMHRRLSLGALSVEGDAMRRRLFYRLGGLQMTEFEKPGTKGAELSDKQESEQQGGLSAEYLLHIADGKKTQKPADKAPKEAEPKIPEPEKLASGDLLNRDSGNEYLRMPDGSKMAIMNNLEMENDLPVPLNERLVLQDKDGKMVSIKYMGTKLSIPPIDEFKFSNGMTASVVNGIAEINFLNGDKMVVDELGLVGIKRTAGEVVIRPAENLQGPMVVPKQPPPHT
jgi:hypothetical protein